MTTSGPVFLRLLAINYPSFNSHYTLYSVYVAAGDGRAATEIQKTNCINVLFVATALA